MKRFSNLVPLVIGFAVLSIVLVLVSRTRIGAQNRSAPVTVENTAAEPALVRDVDNGRAPFQATCGIRQTSDSGDFTCAFGNVADHTRLVIETISGFLSVPQGVAPGAPEPYLQTTTNTVTARHYLRSSFETLAGTDTRTFTEDVRIYADAGTAVFVKASTDATGNSGRGTFTISGYTVPTP